MKILLHTCCGPCASGCIPRLKELGHEVTLFFSNSNIDTAEEFEKRLAAAAKLAAAENVELIADPFNHENWLKEVAAGLESEPEKGMRCRKCFRYNLLKTAKAAQSGNFDGYTTSLTVSPHKPSPLVFSQAPTREFLPIDFKKNEGFKKSLERSRQLSLYRQTYCGCEFSKDK